MKIMELVMKLAPIGIGCYFAYTIGQLGGQIVGNYLQVLLLVCAVCAIIYVVFNTLYAMYCNIPIGKFWKEMIVPSVTAVGTCSSAADGSVITAVAKILFALYFFGMNPSGLGTLAIVILISLMVSMVVGAIPIGGMTGEILICAVLGIDPSFAATLMIIGTICDIPATLVNSTSNLVASALVDRIAGRKNG